ncbi:hypothetical protein F9B74_08255 [Pelistega sp. NLN82]|uniref:DUF6985 domain-containing protein n=1 Tax=Pelistega ratti TaxID=2652177 RepID=A0A6L9Y7N6_9BURK|nr:hypothetical protein [Pelistega ratti]NEN76313.1 hypothetical protein [Pelistega ratti]
MIKHPILGELTFDNGWVKNIKISFLGAMSEIECFFQAFDNEDISPEQIKAYQEYIANSTQLLINGENKLNQYIKENHIPDEEQNIAVKTLFFQRNGSFALLCDCDWDTENGIAIELNPQAQVMLQDLFL